MKEMLYTLPPIRALSGKKYSRIQVGPGGFPGIPHQAIRDLFTQYCNDHPEIRDNWVEASDHSAEIYRVWRYDEFQMVGKIIEILNRRSQEFLRWWGQDAKDWMML